MFHIIYKNGFSFHSQLFFPKLLNFRCGQSTKRKTENNSRYLHSVCCSFAQITIPFQFCYLELTLIKSTLDNKFVWFQLEH